MGSIWLGSLPDVLRNAGLEVEVYPGWEHRSRSSGGYDALLGIQCHHTASSGLNPASDMKYMWENAPARPIGALYLAPIGKWTVGAAGATNTSGKGGPLQTSRGTIPLDAANRYVISVEAANLGDGTPWPAAQQASYVKGVAALNRAYFDGVLVRPGDVHGHFEWTARKVDPAGSSRYAVGASRWDMGLFRSDVLGLLTPPPPPPPPTIPGVPDMFQPIAPVRNSDTRAYPGKPVGPGEMTFGVNGAIPANAVAVAMNIVAVGATADGFVTVWPGGPRTDTSVINFKGDKGAYNGALITGVQNRSFGIYTSQAAHLIVDITGYWTP
jgi:hypothetical protein